ncbi:DUF2304 domain-containing protein [Geothermobacter hydrogeniphilus]|uniref:DUF2304 domain-containing protein n=1 Tax=Geothermobacter hydrogeniphilus TaxID=1969733 RepID=A0A2K2H608_9BACT|nr:DUF2304 domain-containing protein [Geothermobacter hydrogeniphilus]PNU18738.1 DUF2304 domain-containing protein [Geothermobacter hydrogeniphilus]
MPLSQKLFALAVSLLVFLFTVDLVRKRRLREEYSVLWLLTSLGMFVLVLKYEWLVELTHLIGAVLPTTTLFLGSLVFLVLLAVQFSIKLSGLADQVKNLAQENALLRAELEASRGTGGRTEDAVPLTSRGQGRSK